jgi:hypothetical protein
MKPATPKAGFFYFLFYNIEKFYVMKQTITKNSCTLLMIYDSISELILVEIDYQLYWNEERKYEINKGKNYYSDINSIFTFNWHHEYCYLQDV